MECNALEHYLATAWNQLFYECVAQPCNVAHLKFAAPSIPAIGYTPRGAKVPSRVMDWKRSRLVIQEWSSSILPSILHRHRTCYPLIGSPWTGWWTYISDCFRVSRVKKPLLVVDYLILLPTSYYAVCCFYSDIPTLPPRCLCFFYCLPTFHAFVVINLL